MLFAKFADNFRSKLVAYGFVALVAPLAFITAGCGGGGGGLLGGATASASSIITDDLNTGYDHVWVTIKSVDLVSASGTTNIYQSAAGMAVDLETLRDANGNRFLFLDTNPIPAGTYTGVKVTVDDSASIYPAGSTSAVAATFQPSGDFTMSLTFAHPKVASAARDDIVIDFDLTNWILNGTTVTATNNAFLTEGPSSTLGDESRWEAHHYPGTVNNLSGVAGNQTFVLGTVAGAPTVDVTSTTALYNSDGSANPTLANGERVVVKGTYSSSTNSILATSVKIVVGSSGENPEVVGAVSNVNAAGFSFQISPHECDDFQPGQTLLTVNTTSTTLFYGSEGTVYTQSDFFAALANGDVADVEGTVSNGVITATSVKLVSGSNGGGEGGDGGDFVRAEGPSSGLSTSAGTFTITLVQWEGFFGQSQLTLTVDFTSATTWKQNEQSLTESAAEALIGQGSAVNVLGTYDSTAKVLTAAKVTFPKVH